MSLGGLMGYFSVGGGFSWALLPHEWLGALSAVMSEFSFY